MKSAHQWSNSDLNKRFSPSSSLDNRYDCNIDHHRDSIEFSKSLSHQSGNYIRESKTFDSSFDSRKEMMKKPSIGSKANSNYIKQRILQNKSSKTVRPIRDAISREKDDLRRSENKFGSKPILDILLGRYAPKIIKSLAFTRSDQPMNKVFVKNKYAQLF